jgi:hypothetical protein
MKTFLAEWPDGSVSIVEAKDLLSAAIQLDAIEDCPYKAKIWVLRPGFHIAIESAKPGRLILGLDDKYKKRVRFCGDECPCFQTAEELKTARK